MSQVTVLILVPNAGDRLPRCLESIKWADEIFCVVDSKTNDGSEEIARAHTEHVAVRTYENAADQRNWALPQITTEWTFVLDADEWVSDELRGEVKHIIGRPGGANGYQIRRLSDFLGKRIHYCGWDRDYNLRLFRTQKGRYQDRRVHSRVVVEGEVGRIDAPMFHDTYRDFEEYFRTAQRFTDWGAQDLFEQGKHAHFIDLTLRPFIKFLKMYLLRQGFRDGFHGVVLSGLGAVSVFLKYAKLWNLERLAKLEKD